MPKYPWGKKSLEVRATLHPDLVKVFDEVAEEVDTSLLCGHRGKEDQNKAYAEGKSKLQWPNSRHNTFPSEAVDAAMSPVDWGKLQRWKDFAVIVKRCAAKVGVEIEHGGDWKKFRDYPHWQLKKK